MNTECESDEIVVYGTTWCPDVYRARQFLDGHKVSYCWVDIDQDADAEAYVKQVNDGNRSVPTIIFPDGSILVEPSNKQLAAKLRLIA
jgi:glutaredoxin-like protein